jgi:hypothetical protein
MTVKLERSGQNAGSFSLNLEWKGQTGNPETGNRSKAKIKVSKTPSILLSQRAAPLIYSSFSFRALFHWILITVSAITTPGFRMKTPSPMGVW